MEFLAATRCPLRLMGIHPEIQLTRNNKQNVKTLIIENKKKYMLSLEILKPFMILCPCPTPLLAPFSTTQKKQKT